MRRAASSRLNVCFCSTFRSDTALSVPSSGVTECDGRGVRSTSPSAARGGPFARDLRGVMDRRTLRQPRRPDDLRFDLDAVGGHRLWTADQVTHRIDSWLATTLADRGRPYWMHKGCTRSAWRRPQSAATYRLRTATRSSPTCWAGSTV